MGELIALPQGGDVFSDVRGDDRMMRVTPHPDAGVVVVSLWAGKVCRASFRLPEEDVPRLVETLQAVQAEAPAIRSRWSRWWSRLAA
jgi:hypothetical protein